MDIISWQAILISFVVSLIIRNGQGNLMSMNCDFETDDCGFSEYLISDLDWIWGAASTGIGPGLDNTLGTSAGHYLYLDTMTSSTSLNARMGSPFFAATTATMCAEVHVFSSAWSTITLTGFAIAPEFKSFMDLGIFGGSREGTWEKALLEVPPQTLIFQLIFGAKITGDSNGLIVAVDDIRVSEGPCPAAETFGCTFEDPNICGFTNDFTATFDFIRQNMGTPTKSTGPTMDHTLNNANGYYMRIEANKKAEWSSARLISPALQETHSSDEPSCLIFWYHMYGKHMGYLSIYALTSDINPSTTTLWEAVMIWSLSGDQGNTWKKAEVGVDMAHDFVILFEARRGNGNKGDAAIDDMQFIRSADCPAPAIEGLDCTFDSNACGFTPASFDSAGDWNRISTDNPQHPRVTVADHTTGSTSEGKFFVHDATSSTFVVGSLSRLISPLLRPSPRRRCLELYVYMSGPNLNDLNIFRKFVEDTGTSEETLLTMSADTGASWNKISYDLEPTNKYFQLILQVLIRDPPGEGVVAVDDLTVTDGSCFGFPTQPTTDRTTLPSTSTPGEVDRSTTGQLASTVISSGSVQPTTLQDKTATKLSSVPTVSTADGTRSEQERTTLSEPTTLPSVSKTTSLVSVQSAALSGYTTFVSSTSNGPTAVPTVSNTSSGRVSSTTLHERTTLLENTTFPVNLTVSTQDPVRSKTSSKQTSHLASNSIATTALPNVSMTISPHSVSPTTSQEYTTLAEPSPRPTVLEVSNPESVRSTSSSKQTKDMDSISIQGTTSLSIASTIKSAGSGSPLSSDDLTTPIELTSKSFVSRVSTAESMWSTSSSEKTTTYIDFTSIHGSTAISNLSKNSLTTPRASTATVDHTTLATVLKITTESMKSTVSSGQTVVNNNVTTPTTLATVSKANTSESMHSTLSSGLTIAENNMTVPTTLATVSKVNTPESIYSTVSSEQTVVKNNVTIPMTLATVSKVNTSEPIKSTVSPGQTIAKNNVTVTTTLATASDVNTPESIKSTVLPEQTIVENNMTVPTTPATVSKVNTPESIKSTISSGQTIAKNNVTVTTTLANASDFNTPESIKSTVLPEQTIVENNMTVPTTLATVSKVNTQLSIQSTVSHEQTIIKHNMTVPATPASVSKVNTTVSMQSTVTSEQTVVKNNVTIPATLATVSEVNTSLSMQSTFSSEQTIFKNNVTAPTTIATVSEVNTPESIQSTASSEQTIVKNDVTIPTSLATVSKVNTPKSIKSTVSPEQIIDKNNVTASTILATVSEANNSESMQSTVASEHTIFKNNVTIPMTLATVTKDNTTLESTQSTVSAEHTIVKNNMTIPTTPAATVSKVKTSLNTTDVPSSMTESDISENVSASSEETRSSNTSSPFPINSSTDYTTPVNVTTYDFTSVSQAEDGSETPNRPEFSKRQFSTTPTQDVTEGPIIGSFLEKNKVLVISMATVLGGLCIGATAALISRFLKTHVTTTSMKRGDHNRVGAVEVTMPPSTHPSQNAWTGGTSGLPSVETVERPNIYHT